MPNEINGQTGPIPEGRFAIVVARYNTSITENLLRGAIATLTAAGVADSNIDVIRVPGAWELPAVVAPLSEQEDCLAIIALGAVIRGETTHDQHINRAVSLALMQIGLDSGRPILLGLLTCNTVEQAIHRSGGDFGNKGSECAEAALEMVRVMAQL